MRIEPLNFKILLKNLTQLQELVLVGLHISSGLPDSVTNFTSLTALDLSWTELQRNLPESVYHLPNLQRLLLRGNIDLDINLPESFWRSGSSLRELDLSSTNLSGELPDSIGHLKSLTSLTSSKCKLRGSIPKSLGNLIQIHKVDLSVNDLNGEVPYTLSNLKQLTELKLSVNNLKGKFPLWVANLKQLVTLHISYNQLKGPIPSNLSGLQNLQSLGLSSNYFSGVIPPWLFTLPSLEAVDLSSNRLTGQIPKFQHDLPLDSIDLSNNKLRGPIPKSISTLVNLTRLFLASNDLSGVVDLQKPKNVEALDLSNTNLSVVARSHVNNTLPNLRYFKMSSCNIEVFPYFLRTLENLVVLDLSSNRIHGQVPNWVGLIGKASLEQIPSLICNASSLRILDLSRNKLSGAVPQCLENFNSVLSVLNLRSNGFTGTLPLAFAKANQLRSLDLSGNQLEGPLPRSLADCTSLEVLNVGNNKINDTFPYWLETLLELQVLVVRSNRFHGPIYTSKSKFPFPKLRIVELSYNEFNGHLPVTYFKYFQATKNKTMPGKNYMSDVNSYYHYSIIVTIKGLEGELLRILTIFTTIGFSSNNFSGEIPNVIGKLNSLIVLNFSHNSLTGHIPSSLGDLEILESLDISSNQLTGRIPSRLTRLCGLPLSKECEDNNRTKVQPAVLEQEEDDSDIDASFWKIVVIGYGCGMTLGLFLGSLMFLIGRSKFFVRLAEREKPKNVIRLRRMVTDIVSRRK
ncbi:receptor-like protein 35 [Rhododendron vialii]|uniref:receptor-like protein 35 n=1 Tax=Rhododendron vialii TaxID=182163 RepID=UPI00265F32A6|nr:receptor-like protein 35 [Rhododendron vialii]